MKYNWFATACATALALLALACGSERTPSRGYLLDIATAPERCGDGRNIVITAIGQHRVRINPDLVLDTDSAAYWLRDTFRTRAYRDVYVRAEPGVAFGEFAELVDRVWPEAEVVSILTPQVEVLAIKRFCLEPSCGLCEEFRTRALRRSHEN
jgi:hypothetical protein